MQPGLAIEVGQLCRDIITVEVNFNHDFAALPPFFALTSWKKLASPSIKAVGQVSPTKISLVLARYTCTKRCLGGDPNPKDSTAFPASFASGSTKVELPPLSFSQNEIRLRWPLNRKKTRSLETVRCYPRAIIRKVPRSPIFKREG